jgi:glycosyltransferase involved in cell wall biosynthesis
MSLEMEIPHGHSLRIGIFAMLSGDGWAGGTERMLVGLVHALGRLEGDDEYVILTKQGESDWIESHLQTNQSILARSVTKSRRSLPRRAVDGALSSRFGQQIVAKARDGLCSPFPKNAYVVFEPETSDGWIESLDLDVIRFPYQQMVRTAVPSIFSPWDLVHLHYPHFFTPRQVAEREAYYPVACRAATALVAGSGWVKQDLVDKYAISPQKVQVIPIAPATEMYAPASSANIRRVLELYALGEQFVFYPAQTYPHKNHIRLLRAIALLRNERNMRVNLVCTGKQGEHWESIKEEIAHLHLEQQVRFLGFVPGEDVRALYATAQAVILPTLFEGGCVPMIEAFGAGVPVACSTVQHLPEQAGGAALLFDPMSVPAIADALARITSDGDLRAELRFRGLERARLFTWHRVALMHRALYRKTAGSALGEVDQELLRAPFAYADSDSSATLPSTSPEMSG